MKSDAIYLTLTIIQEIVLTADDDTQSVCNHANERNDVSLDLELPSLMNKFAFSRPLDTTGASPLSAQEEARPTIAVLNDGDDSEDYGEDLQPLPSDASDMDELQEVVSVPRETHDRPRRLLHGHDGGLLLATMRGALHLITRESPR